MPDTRHRVFRYGLLLGLVQEQYFLLAVPAPDVRVQQHHLKLQWYHQRDRQCVPAVLAFAAIQPTD